MESVAENVALGLLEFINNVIKNHVQEGAILMMFSCQNFSYTFSMDRIKIFLFLIPTLLVGCSLHTNSFGSGNTSALSSISRLQNSEGNGTLQGRVSFAPDCDVPACSKIDITSLGILIRQSTKDIQPDGSTAITVKDLKFNNDRTYSVSLPAGTYILYEDNNDWNFSRGLNTSSIPVTPVTITAGNTTALNIVIDNIKPNLPL